MAANNACERARLKEVVKRIKKAPKEASERAALKGKNRALRRLFLRRLRSEEVALKKMKKKMMKKKVQGDSRAWKKAALLLLLLLK